MDIINSDSDEAQYHHSDSAYCPVPMQGLQKLSDCIVPAAHLSRMPVVLHMAAPHVFPRAILGKLAGITKPCTAQPTPTLPHSTCKTCASG